MTLFAAPRQSLSPPRPGPQPAAAAALELNAGERWFVAVTLPHKEHYACANLANQGVRHFLPLQLVTTRHARKFRTALAPVFPRYIFVILNVERQRWRSVNGTFGVQRLLADRDAPLPVPMGVVETLIRSSDPRGQLLVEAEVLHPGDKIRLLSGPFAGHLGVLLKLNSADRVQLLLDIVGGSFRVNAPRDAIVAL